MATAPRESAYRPSSTVMADADVSPLETAVALTEAAKTDTVYRDVYIERARALSSGTLPEADYRRLEADRLTTQELPIRIGRAVENGRWAEVKELTGRLQTIRNELVAKRRLLEIAAPVFATDIALDPFSPGLQLFTGLSSAAQIKARKEAIERLGALVRVDGARRSFYEARRRALEALEIRGSEEDATGTQTPPSREAAVKALETGDMRRLRAVAEAMLETPVEPRPRRQGPATVAEVTPRTTDLSFTWEDDTLVAATRLGLAPRHLDAHAEIAALRTYAWHPLFADGAQRIGVKNVPLPAGTDEGFRERFEMFMIHAMVNSGGARHLPQLGQEDVLVEDFPDPPKGGAVTRGPLLEALGFPARRGVSRDAVEQKLQRDGMRIVEEDLHLDPLQFRLVCIPPDVHLRLGAREAWGRQESWTHFDGYIVMANGRLRALAGGDVRYGGLYNLVGIGRDYDSDNVILRLAVVRRERMTAW